MPSGDERSHEVEHGAACEGHEEERWREEHPEVKAWLIAHLAETTKHLMDYICVADGRDEEPRQQPASDAAEECQHEILMDDLVQQCAPLGAESLADAHLGTAGLHTVGNQAAQVDGGEQQEKQHQQRRRHQFLGLHGEVLVAGMSEEVQSLEEVGIGIYLPLSPILAKPNVVGCIVILAQRLNLVEEVLAAAALAQQKAHVELAGVTDLVEVLVGVVIFVDFHRIGDVDVGRGILHKRAHRFDHTDDAKRELPLATCNADMRGTVEPLGQLVGDDAHALAQTKLLLGEGTPTEERQVVEVEEAGVGAEGIDTRHKLPALVGDAQVGRPDACGGLNAFQLPEARVEGGRGEAHVELAAIFSQRLGVEAVQGIERAAAVRLRRDIRQPDVQEDGNDHGGGDGHRRSRDVDGGEEFVFADERHGVAQKKHEFAHGRLLYLSSVEEFDDAVGLLGLLFVVRHHDDGAAVLLV